MLSSIILINALFALASASPLARRCVSTIASASDVAAAVSSKCETINIEAQTFPAATTLDLSGLADGTTVSFEGDVTFAGGTPWKGPLIKITGHQITVNGNGHTLDGQGAKYWDGLGGNGGVAKPVFVWLGITGSLQDLTLLNTPVFGFAINNRAATAPFTISNCIIDNRDGNALVADGSGALAHNTDGFDVIGDDVTITGCTVFNQDDCLAFLEGSRLVFSNNYCDGSHGASFYAGQDVVIADALVSGNSMVDGMIGLRIKTGYGLSGSTVSNITWADNCVSGSNIGIEINQDYNNAGSSGTASNGIIIEDIFFTGTNTIDVPSDGVGIHILCGDGSCRGTWDFSGVSITGDIGTQSGDPPITGLTVPAA